MCSKFKKKLPLLEKWTIWKNGLYLFSSLKQFTIRIIPL